MARVDSNVNPLDLGTTESHSPAACSCIEPSGPRARSSPNVKVAARSVTERPGPVLLPGENLFSSIPPTLSFSFSSARHDKILDDSSLHNSCKIAISIREVEITFI